MKQLACEMCGSTDLVKQDGIFVCQTCGCKYSIEEARKMMVEGTVRVDNTHMIANYLEMAQAAKDAGNNQEAESYCNKVIEIEPTNYKAWMLKGEAAAWQSTLQNSRVDEGVSAFVKGIANAPEEEKEELIEQAKQQIKNLSTAMISLHADRFAKWPDEEEAAGFLSDITAILGSVVNFISGTGTLIPIAEIMASIARQINDAVTRAWQNVIWPEYFGDPNDYDYRAGKYEWETFIKRVGYCTNLLEKAIDLCDENDEEEIPRYDNLIFIHKAAIESCSWDYELSDWGTKYWYKKWMLTDEAKKIRRNKISGYEAKVSEIKKSIAAKEAAEKAEKERIKREEAQKRFDAYWAEHEDEKASLESEKSRLMADIDALQSEIGAIPGETEKHSLQERISKLTADKDALGIFKGKEKKAIQEQIDATEREMKTVVDRMEAAAAEIQKRIDPLKNRIDAIETELTKAR